MNCILRHAVWSLPLLSSASFFLPSSGRAAQEEEPIAEAALWTQAELEAVTLKIQEQIEELRDAKFANPVTVALMNREELLEYMQERILGHSTPEEMRSGELVYKLLGLLAPETDLMAQYMSVVEGQAVGLYAPERETFYLMDWVTSEGMAKITLAHELTHALDDQLYDLDAPLASSAMTTDAGLAYHSVVEGSGMAAMTRWIQANPTEWNFEELLELQSMSSGSLDGLSEIAWKPTLASYMHGEAFLRRESATLNMFGKVVKNEDVIQAFGDPPLSSEQVMHPEKYWSDEKRDLPVELAFEVGELPTGWSADHRDTLGELVLSLITTPQADRGGVDLTDPAAALAIQFTNDAASGWGGDRFVLLESEKAAVLRGLVAWDTREDAEEFVRAIQGNELELEKNLFGLAQHHGLVEPVHSQFRIERKNETLVQLTASFGVDEAELGRILDAVVPKTP